MSATVQVWRREDKMMEDMRGMGVVVHLLLVIPERVSTVRDPIVTYQVVILHRKLQSAV